MLRPCLAVVVLLSALGSSSMLAAQEPMATAQILPSSTKGYLAAPDLDLLTAQWRKTQLGQLAEDEAMKPFLDDLQRQMRERLDESGRKLQITWDDLQGIASGEAATATIQPDNDPQQHAVALVVRVAGNEAAARELLAKIERNQLAKGARKSTLEIGGSEVVQLIVPPRDNGNQQTRALYTLREGWLLASDDLKVITEMIAQVAGATGPALASLEAYQAVQLRATAAAKGETPHLRWFVEPFGYFEVLRAADTTPRERGKDMLNVLRKQGFDAVRGLGGLVFLATGEYEMLHRTFIYAPPVAGSDSDETVEVSQRYRLAARMLDFPNVDSHVPPAWVPRELAGFLSLNWKMQNAFEYSSTLVDEVVGSEGTFEDVIAAIRDDVQGPQIDLRENLVAHLGERAVMISDYRVPITPKSQRITFAIQVDDPAEVAETIEKALRDDPQARRREIGGQVIWEIIDEEEEEDIPAVLIQGPGFGGFGDFGQQEREEEETRIPNSAITVAHGHLLIGSHVDQLVELVKPVAAQNRLVNAADYQQVMAALGTLGAEQSSFKHFVRTDEAARATYELLKQGKMPQSETLLGRLLNRLLGSGEDDELREQELDADKLPDYQVVRRYLGPAGNYVVSQRDGWMVTGCLLTK